MTFKRSLIRWLTLTLTLLLLLPAASLAETAAPVETFASTEAAQAADAASATTAPTDTNAQGKPYVLDAFAGTNLDLTQYAGKAIWLNFFTGWCSYCMEEIPYIKQVFDEYDPDQLQIILIHVWDGENADDSAAIVKKYGLEDMLLVEDEKLDLSNLVGLQGFPTNLFIDKEGYLHSGSYGLTYDEMVAYMDALNVGKKPDAAGTAQ